MYNLGRIDEKMFEQSSPDLSNLGTNTSSSIRYLPLFPAHSLALPVCHFRCCLVEEIQSKHLNDMVEVVVIETRVGRDL